MNKSAYFAMAFAIFLAVSITAYAQSKQIYTWTDENGVVHYVDTPPDNPNAVSIDAPEAYRPGSTGAYPEADAEADADADAEVVEDEEVPAAVESYADEKRAQLAQDREKAQAEQAQRARTCAEATKQLEAIQPYRRVFYTNEEGETERMDDEERVRLVAEAQALVDQNCN